MGIWNLLGIEHTAELRGERVVFYSSAKRYTHMLFSDAVQACKEAGIYKSSSDASRIILDGHTPPYPEHSWE